MQRNCLNEVAFTSCWVLHEEAAVESTAQRSNKTYLLHPGSSEGNDPSSHPCFYLLTGSESWVKGFLSGSHVVVVVVFLPAPSANAASQPVRINHGSVSWAPDQFLCVASSMLLSFADRESNVPLSTSPFQFLQAFVSMCCFPHYQVVLAMFPWRTKLEKKVL